MRSKIAVRLVIVSAILFISIIMVFAETAKQTNESLMAGQNATLNQTTNETINQTLNETANQTKNITEDVASIFNKVKGVPPDESDR